MFGQEPGGPDPDGRTHYARFGYRGHDHHGRLRAGLDQPHETVEPVHVGQVEIEQDHIRRPRLGQEGKPLFQRATRFDIGDSDGRAQRHGQGVAKERVVVDDKCGVQGTLHPNGVCPFQALCETTPSVLCRVLCRVVSHGRCRPSVCVGQDAPAPCLVPPFDHSEAGSRGVLA